MLSVLDTAPVVLPEQLKLWHWIADYYMCMPGEVFAAALPSGLKADKGFKPKMESYVTLAPAYRSQQGIHMAFDMMGKSARQQNLFACYLQLSHWDDEEEDEKKEITREELLNVSHELSSILTQIEKKGILKSTTERWGDLTTMAILILNGYASLVRHRQKLIMASVRPGVSILRCCCME